MDLSNYPHRLTIYPEDEDLYFIGDTHFSHASMIKRSFRPEYSTVEEMNEAIIAAWQETVDPGDVIIHVGDWGFCGTKELRSHLAQLGGQIFFVGGNHDKKSWRRLYEESSLYPFAQSIGNRADIRVKNGQKVGSGHQDLRISVSHHPMQIWPLRREGGYHFHGHCHGDHRNGAAGPGLRMDVGVDVLKELTGSVAPIHWTDAVETTNERATDLNPPNVHEQL